MTTPSRSRGSRLWLRVLITLLLIAVVITVLVFSLTQPVAAPGSTPEATEPSGAALPSGFVFMSDRDGDWEIFAASAGGAVTNLSSNDVNDGFPSYSVDTAQISYVSAAAGVELGGFLMDSNGANQVPAAADLRTFLNILANGRGDWDRRDGTNGHTLISLRDLNLEVYYQSSSDDSARNMSSSGAIDWYANLSPDGTRIAFASDRVDVQHDIYTISTDGGTLTRLTDDPANDWSPHWSASGDQLIFASERARPFSEGLDLYTLTMSGEAMPIEGVFTSAGVIMDGVTLYMSNESGNWEIYARDAAGAVTNLTNNPADDLFAVWLPRPA